MAYPAAADAPVVSSTPAQAPEVRPRHTEEEAAQLQAQYEELKPEAVMVYLNYFLARTKAEFQDDMKDLISADLAIPPTPPVEALLTTRPYADEPEA